MWSVPLKRQRGEQVNQKVKLTEEAEKKRDKKKQDQEERTRELSDSIKWKNIHMIGIQQEEEKEKGVEGVLEQIIAENFPNLEKETNTEMQEAQRTPFRM